MGIFLNIKKKCRRESGQTDDKRRCPANEGHYNSTQLWRPITEDEGVESVDAHRNDEEE